MLDEFKDFPKKQTRNHDKVDCNMPEWKNRTTNHLALSHKVEGVVCSQGRQLLWDARSK